ncbi:bifunctional ornithine acetyltransferase/N-acetylglutamate synthase [Clostridiaceae bacterium HSG29]|nr:bifunctional ornithine acetyltransferase/N-acetylglutamate synthase [Clostridiaceae bacterium HSG29]
MINNYLKTIKGFIGNSIHSGIKYKKLDLAVIYSEVPCIAAGAFTTNKTVAAPVIISREKIKNPIQAIIVNSGNANAATGNQGMEDGVRMCKLISEKLKINPDSVLVSSTGVIGVKLPMDKIESGIAKLENTLSEKNLNKIPKGIMTTDTFEKKGSVSFFIEGEEIIINGMAKGSGMIHPNMATMLGFMTSNVNISKELMQEALSEVVDKTYNMISVDGDTSTNDMVLLLSNKKANHTSIDKKNDDYNKFLNALYELTEFLAIEIARDGEGATKLLKVDLINANSLKDAKILAKSIITSSLVKSAFFGEDANWGRVLSSLGASGASMNPDKVDLIFKSSFGEIELMKNGEPLIFNEEVASKVLSDSEIEIKVNMNDGRFYAKSWGCDLTYDYVKINAEYRS